MKSKLHLAVRHKLFKPGLGATLTIFAGFMLWAAPFGERWIGASFDALFHFTSRAATNNVVLVLMDERSLSELGQKREEWDRAIHARFLNRLADDGCPLVVMDVFFDSPRQPAATTALIGAMKRLSNVVIMAEPTNVLHTNVTLSGRERVLQSVQPVFPLEIFLDAVRGTNWGLGGVDVTARDFVVRKQWPFRAPGIYQSMAGRARAESSGWPDTPPERWIRYYAPGHAWQRLSYVDAERQTNGFFRDKIVFIGNEPQDRLFNGEDDEFLTPFSRIGSDEPRTAAGVEILATQFLNIVNNEWLRRAPMWVEFSILALTGVGLGFGLCGRRFWVASVGAGAAAFGALAAGACLTHFTNYWFPWLIVVGAQIPVAWAWAAPWSRVRTAVGKLVRHLRPATLVVGTPASSFPSAPVPIDDVNLRLPDYELVHPPFGAGAYGKVWLARNAVNQWQALKVVYRAKFGDDASPYEREFRGIENYKRVSDRHPGLLRIDFVSRMKPEGYFYYAMELGDAATRGWKENPASYRPLDLAAVCAAHNARVPVGECVRIAVKLCEALSFLHENGLTHRDIKPRNVIFVNGQPKLADVGLVSDTHRPAQDMSFVGTPGYMPPEPEPPGTPQADIYGLGMMLYVISTGLKPTSFPELTTTMVDRNRFPDFSTMSPIIFRACQPDRALRYQTVEEMRAALLEVGAKLSAAKCS